MQMTFGNDGLKEMLGMPHWWQMAFYVIYLTWSCVQYFAKGCVYGDV